MFEGKWGRFFWGILNRCWQPRCSQELYPYIHVCEFFQGYPEGKQGRHLRITNTSQGWAAFIDQLDPDTRVSRINLQCLRELRYTFSSCQSCLLANTLELKRMASGRHIDRADASDRMGSSPANANRCTGSFAPETTQPFSSRTHQPSPKSP